MGPASAGELAALCTICQANGIDCKNTCGHLFHWDCMANWVNSNNANHLKCPNCLQDLDSWYDLDANQHWINND
jgi:hypothetical protein